WGVAPRAPVQGRTRHHGESRVRKGGSVSESPYAFYVGVDWASETHQFTVLTPERRLEGERRIEHTGRALREMAAWVTALRDEEELQTELRRLSNRLWEQLQRFYPQVLRLSPAVDEPWIWALLQLAPTPVAARALRRATLARLLARHRIRRVTAETVLAELHS